jgi:hypothetical protein
MTSIHTIRFTDEDTGLSLETKIFGGEINLPPIGEHVLLEWDAEAQAWRNMGVFPDDNRQMVERLIARKRRKREQWRKKR